LKEEVTGFSSVPFISPAHHIPSEAKRVFLTVCCDGIWDVYTSEDACKILSAFPQTKADEAAKALIAKTVKSGKCDDNVTVIVVNIRKE
jgi:serine/threonine protein phosphatase PrpC